MKYLKVAVLFIGAMQIQNESVAQAEAINQLSIEGGLHQLSLFDKQASPLLYKGAGPAFSLAYGRVKENHQWAIQANGGLLTLKPNEIEQVEDPGSTISAGMHITYLHRVKNSKKMTWWAGASLNEDLLVNLNYEIGGWAYVFAQGGLYANTQLNYQLNPKNSLKASLAIPVVAVVTDMPFHQIPRVEGRPPDVVSLFKVGTRMPFWNSYQMIAGDFVYEVTANQKWKMNVCYRWSWTHDSKPLNLWVTDATFSLKLIRTW